jgi:hypothetical protein
MDVALTVERVVFPFTKAQFALAVDMAWWVASPFVKGG